jgi:hypothetical protein
MQKTMKTIVVVSLLACLGVATWAGIENRKGGAAYDDRVVGKHRFRLEGKGHNRRFIITKEGQ